MNVLFLFHLCNILKCDHNLSNIRLNFIEKSGNNLIIEILNAVLLNFIDIEEEGCSYKGVEGHKEENLLEDAIKVVHKGKNYPVGEPFFVVEDILGLYGNEAVVAGHDEGVQGGDHPHSCVGGNG